MDIRELLQSMKEGEIIMLSTIHDGFQINVVNAEDERDIKISHNQLERTPTLPNTFIVSAQENIRMTKQMKENKKANV